MFQNDGDRLRKRFNQRMQVATKPTERKGQYILIRKLLKANYWMMYVCRPKYSLPGQHIRVNYDDDDDDDDNKSDGNESVVNLRNLSCVVIDKAALIRRSCQKKVNYINCLKNEKLIRLSAECPFIHNIVDCFKDNCNLYIVSEFGINGCLRQHIQYRAKHKPTDEPCFSADEVCGIVEQLVLALEYLHNVGVMHRDFRSDNILVDRLGHLQVTGFACAKPYCYGRTTTLIGSKACMSPEMLNCMFKQVHYVGASSTQIKAYTCYSGSVDVWGLGIVIYELLDGLPPFKDEELFNYWCTIIDFSQRCSLVADKTEPAAVAGMQPRYGDDDDVEFGSMTRVSCRLSRESAKLGFTDKEVMKKESESIRQSKPKDPTAHDDTHGDLPVMKRNIQRLKRRTADWGSTPKRALDTLIDQLAMRRMRKSQSSLHYLPLMHLICCLLTYKPNRRLGFESNMVNYIKNHPLFMRTNFDQYKDKNNLPAYRPDSQFVPFAETSIDASELKSFEVELFPDEFGFF